LITFIRNPSCVLCTREPFTFAGVLKIENIIFQYKGNNGTTKLKKPKSDGSHNFLIFLLYFSSFHARESCSPFSLSLFSLSLFLISPQPNRLVVFQHFANDLTCLLKEKYIEKTSL